MGKTTVMQFTVRESSVTEGGVQVFYSDSEGREYDYGLMSHGEALDVLSAHLEAVLMPQVLDL